MAPRPAWKGYLKLSLVTCAVELSGATTPARRYRSARSTAKPAMRCAGNISTRPPASRSTTRTRCGLRGREGRVPADRGRGHRGGADRILAHAEPRQLRRESRRRPGLYREALLPRARRQGFGGSLRRHPAGAGEQEDGRAGAHRALPARAARASSSRSARACC